MTNFEKEVKEIIEKLTLEGTMDNWEEDLMKSIEDIKQAIKKEIDSIVESEILCGETFIKLQDINQSLGITK